MSHGTCLNVAGINQETLDKYAAAFNEANPHKNFDELTPEEYSSHIKAMQELVEQNFCPTGVANSDVLFVSEPWRIEQVKLDMAAAIRTWFMEHGYEDLEAFRRDESNVVIEQPKDLDPSVFGTFDFSPFTRNDEEVFLTRPKNDNALRRKDDEWLPQIQAWLDAAERGENPPPVIIESDTSPKDRSVSASTSSAICLKVTDGRINMEAYPDRKLVSSTGVARIKLNGNVGQSFGFALAHGLQIEANVAQDGIGKSGAGGVIIVNPEIPDGHPCPQTYRDNCVIGGNTIAYGNQGSNIYIHGKVGSRAGVCMHGGKLVCEGMKDFGAEYMTNGMIVSLGPVGNFFGNAMSGGLAFVYDPDRAARKSKINFDDVRELADDEGKFAIQEALKQTIEEHFQHTGSDIAKKILDNWSQEKENFAYLVPRAYDQFRHRAGRLIPG